MFWSPVRDGCWVSVRDAYFVPVDHIPDVAICTLINAEYSVVSLPQPIIQTIKKFEKSLLLKRTISPALVREAIQRSESSILPEERDERIQLLVYVLSDVETKDFKQLDGLFRNHESSLHEHYRHCMILCLPCMTVLCRFLSDSV